LHLIGTNPGICQVEIAQTLLIDRGTMREIADYLDRRGYMSRRAHPVDRRRQKIYLTATGEEALVAACRHVSELDRRFASQFTDAELERLFAALRRLSCHPAFQR
jgi:DNA-binding MarR family transcriptional regulator